ncbi:MAG TPA: hypothetical protein VMI55_02760 [Thermoplasmata archaeon]|nr:hypothetical protein [Thermoplasmata archaeon]
MTPRWLAPLLVLALLTAGGLTLLAPAAASSGATPSQSSPLKGNITGPTVLATGANQRYLIQATGGPAVAPNGTIVGNLTYYASVTGPNPTGVMITPTSAALLAGTPGQPLLTPGSVPQTLTISVELVSVLNASNETLNLTYVVQVVQPYVVAAEIFNPSNLTASSFPVAIDLDGTQVGNVTIPSLLAHTGFNLSFSYATLSLSTGWHSFSISLYQAHGLLKFANGSTEYDQSFYIPGPAPDYTIWYITGVVAFLGVLFIFGARVGARRRGATKK